MVNKNFYKKGMLTLAILGLVGAAVHLLQPLGVNLLTLGNSFGGYSNVVQFLAGLGGVIFILTHIRK